MSNDRTEDLDQDGDQQDHPHEGPDSRRAGADIEEGMKDIARKNGVHDQIGQAGSSAVGDDPPPSKEPSRQHQNNDFSHEPHRLNTCRDEER